MCEYCSILNLSSDVLLIVGIYSCYDDVNRFFCSMKLFFKKWRKLH